MYQLKFLSHLGLAAIAVTLTVQSAEAKPPERSQESIVGNVRALSHSAKTVKEWLAQMEAQPAIVSVPVTSVKVERTATGLDIVLETQDGKPLSVDASKFRTEGNALIADIPNTVLALPQGNEYRVDDPSLVGEDVESVSVTQTDAATVRVSVVGKGALPTGEVTLRTGALAYSLNPEAGEPDEEVVVTGTRTPTSIQDVPQSIQVIPRQTLDDRGVVRLDEFTDNVSGVQRSSAGDGQGSGGFIIRGFPDGFENLRNGFRTQGGFPRDLANIERVEVLKGPASALYGSGFQSGVVNIITEKPLEIPRYEIKGFVGSYDFYRGEVDLTGPLTEDKTALYRLNFAYQNNGSFRDFLDYESVFVAPSVTLKLGSRTSLTLEYEYLNANYPDDNGFLTESEFLRISPKTFLGEPELAKEEFTSHNVALNFLHEFSDNWQYRLGFNGLFQDVFDEGVVQRTLQADRRTLNRRFDRRTNDLTNLALQNEILGKFNTGSIQHELLFGVEYFLLEYAYTFANAPIGPIDIFNPVYGARPTRSLIQTTNGAYGSNNVGVYLQDLITLLPNLKLLAGVRFDNVYSFFEDRDPQETINEVSDNNFSPRFGILYQPSNSTSLYASYSQSFTPQFFGTNSRGGAFKPEETEQFEVGVRQGFFNNRLLGSLAAYQVTRKNVSTPDISTPEDFDRIQVGEQRSRGIELDVTGEILPGWKIIATYAYIDAVVTKDNSLPIGDRLPNVPYNSASLWTTYQIQKGDWQGFGVGLGLVYVGDRAVPLPNTLEVPSYLRVDASIFYRKSNFEARLNFKNLSNINYYDSTDFGTLVPQEPFTVIGRLSFQF